MNNSGERKKKPREKRDKKGLYILSGYSWYFFLFPHKIGNYCAKHLFNRSQDFVLSSHFFRIFLNKHSLISL
jgi:hypothetical protein